MIPYLSAHAQAKKARDANGRSALWWAVATSNLELVQILLITGMDINEQDVLGDTALHGALLYDLSSRDAIVKTLLDHDPNLTLVNNFGDTCLSYALYVDCVDVRSYLVQKSLKAGVSTNHRNNDSDTILMSWARLSPRDTHLNSEINLLFRAGADIDAQNKRGKTALMLATYWGNTSMTEILLERGARCDLLNIDEENILHIVAKRPDAEILKILLGYDLSGVDSRAQNKNGSTPEDLFRRGQYRYDDNTIEAFYTLLDKVTSQYRVQDIKRDRTCPAPMLLPVKETTQTSCTRIMPQKPAPYSVHALQLRPSKPKFPA